MDAFQVRDTGFPIRYRFDGKLFNQRRLQAKTKVQTAVTNTMKSVQRINTVNVQKLKVVDTFAHMGSTLSRAVHINDQITARTAKAKVAFGRMRICLGSEM